MQVSDDKNIIKKERSTMNKKVVINNKEKKGHSTMNKTLKKVVALFLAIFMIVSVPTSALAATYSNNSTVKVSCKKDKTYNYNFAESTWYGSVKVYTGNLVTSPYVELSQSSAGHGVGTGKVRYMRASITTYNGKTYTITKKLELVEGNTKTKITTNEYGKETVTYKSHTAFYQYITIKAKGAYLRDIKSIYVTASYSGGSDPATQIYFKG